MQTELRNAYEDHPALGTSTTTVRGDRSAEPAGESLPAVGSLLFGTGVRTAATSLLGGFLLGETSGGGGGGGGAPDPLKGIRSLLRLLIIAGAVGVAFIILVSLVSGP